MKNSETKEEYEIEIQKHWNIVKIIFNDDIDRLK